jgi:hypothetical protein
MRYLPTNEFAARPCIVVDGAPRAEALITVALAEQWQACDVELQVFPNPRLRFTTSPRLRLWLHVYNAAPFDGTGDLAFRCDLA